MTRSEFIDYLKNRGIHHLDFKDKYVDAIYVYKKEEYEKYCDDPEEYIPYIRVSGFENEICWYVRDNGMIYEETPEEIIKIIEEMGAV